MCAVSRAGKNPHRGSCTQITELRIVPEEHVPLDCSVSVPPILEGERRVLFRGISDNGRLPHTCPTHTNRRNEPVAPRAVRAPCRGCRRSCENGRRACAGGASSCLPRAQALRLVSGAAILGLPARAQPSHIHRKWHERHGAHQVRFPGFPSDAGLMPSA